LNWGDHHGIAGAFHARDPHVPAQATAENLEQPASREELKKRAEELKK